MPWAQKAEGRRRVRRTRHTCGGVPLMVHADGDAMGKGGGSTAGRTTQKIPKTSFFLLSPGFAPSICGPGGMIWRLRGGIKRRERSGKGMGAGAEAGVEDCKKECTGAGRRTACSGAGASGRRPSPLHRGLTRPCPTR